MTTLRELTVLGVRIERSTRQPVVLLQEQDGDSYVPIWVGATEAAAIAMAMSDETPARPLTHALLLNTVSALGSSLQEVRIVDLIDGVFFASVHLSSGQCVDSRSSDALALALHADVPIRIEETVLRRVGVVIPTDIEHDVSEFREFLADVNPEDFRD